MATQGPPVQSRPARWIRVEFHGLVPEGEELVDINPTEICENLMKVFGFRSIDGLTVTQT